MQHHTYRYKLLTEQGKILRGLVQAPIGYPLPTFFESSQNHILKMRKLSTVESFFCKPRVCDQSKLDMTVQWSYLIKAGVSLTDSLKVLAEACSSPIIHSTLLRIWTQLQQGETLSQAMQAHPFLFDLIYIHLVQVGEQHGQLADAFQKLVQYLQKRVELKEKLQKATLYPSLLLSMMVLLILSLSFFVLPRLKEFVGALGSELSPATRFMLWWGECIEVYGYMVMCVFILILIFSLSLYIYSERYAQIIDRLLLKIPILGEMFLLYNLSGYLMHFRILSTDGRSVIRALRESPQIVSNTFLKKQLQTRSHEIHEGSTLANLFYQLKWMPRLVTQMIHVGENSGELAKSLVFAEEYLQNTLWTKVDRSVRFIEPLLLLIIGGFFLWIVIAVFLPLYDHIGQVS